MPRKPLKGLRKRKPAATKKAAVPLDIHGAPKAKGKKKLPPVPPAPPAPPAPPPPPAELLHPTDPVQSILRAAAFASRKHDGQTRADGVTPYFSHVSRVAFILAHVFGVQDHEVLTAAFLHDTVEDTATDYDELEETFGTRVADYVIALTKNVMLPKKKREDEYAARLIDAPEPVKIAKLADLFDNLSDRVNSPRIVKTTATAARLLEAFAPQMQSEVGRGAHARVAALLAEIERAR